MTSTLSANALVGDTVVDVHGVDVGTLDDIVMNLHGGTVAYCVVAVGGVLGLGAKFFAVPWRSLRLDLARKRVQLLFPASVLERATGFDKSSSPESADPALDARRFAPFSPSVSV